MLDDVDIIVLTTKHKRSLASELLTQEEVEHHCFVNEDFTYPSGMPIDERGYKCEPKQEIAYRIFRGHQCCTMLVHKPYGLILEDDAVPLPNWKAIVEKCRGLLHSFDVVALYGQALNFVDREFTFDGLQVIVPGVNPQFGVRWTNGAVAYLVSNTSADTIRSADYQGYPFDIYLSHCTKFCVLHGNNQCFGHSYRYGSHFHSVEPPCK